MVDTPAPRDYRLAHALPGGCSRSGARRSRRRATRLRRRHPHDLVVGMTGGVDQGRGRGRERVEPLLSTQYLRMDFNDLTALDPRGPCAADGCGDRVDRRRGRGAATTSALKHSHTSRGGARVPRASVLAPAPLDGSPGLAASFCRQQVAGPLTRDVVAWRKGQMITRGGRTRGDRRATASRTRPPGGAAARVLMGRSTPMIPLAYVDRR